MTRESSGPSLKGAVSRHPAFGRLLPSALILIGAGCLVAYALLSPLSSDEGWYLAGAHLASEGKVPYLDFAYSQGPVVPLVHGLALRFLGSRLVTQRLLGALWGALTLAFFVAGFRRRASAAKTAVILLPAVASLGWHSQVALGNTFGLAGFFLALSAWSLLREGRSPYAAPVTAVCFATVSTACRLTVAPFPCALLGLIALGKRRAPVALAAASAGAGVLAVLLGPFLLFALEPTSFWLVGYHLGTSLVRSRADVFLEAITLYPALPVALAVGLWGLFRGGWRSERNASVLFVAAAVGVVSSLALPSSYGGYVTPFVPLLLTTSTFIALAATPAASRRFGSVAAAALSAALGIALPPPIDLEWLGDLRETTAIVRRIVPPGHYVFTSRPETAIEAGRTFWPGLEMGMFSVTEEIPADRAQRLHLVSPARFREALLDPRTRGVVLSVEPLWNLGASVPSLRPLSPTRVKALQEVFTSRFVPERGGRCYIVFRARGEAEGGSRPQSMPEGPARRLGGP